MMNKKKVSVIVPVYNVEKYIDKCLKSLVNQTLSDIEIVVVNDGSLDNSEDIIKKYEKKYSDIIKYIKIKNGGVANARNVGLDNATGEYIGFCDSDDYVEEDMYELLYDKAKSTKADIVVGGYYSEKDDGSLINKELDNMSYYSKYLEENPDILLVGTPFVATKLFSSKLLKNLRFKKYRIFEDLLFCYSAMLKANKIEKVNKSLYHYIRRKNESVTGSLNSKFYDLFPVIEELKDFYKENSEINFNDYLTYIAIHHAYLRFTSRVGIKKIGLKYRYIRDSYKFLDKFDSNWKNNMYFSLKKRKSGVYRTKLFWLFFPFLKKFKSLLVKIRKKTIANYGYKFIRNSYNSILEKNIFFESQKGNDINGSMFYLIKEIRSDSKYDSYVVNVAVSKNRIEEFKKKFAFYNISNYNLLVINSSQYIKHLARDKYLFTDTSFPIYFKKRKEQVYLNTWHGVPLKYLGRSVMYDFYNISNVMKNFLIADYILYPNEFMKDAMIKDYMLDIRKNKILMLGYPRSSVFFSKVKRNDKQRIAYMPTWRGTMTNIGGNNYISTLEEILFDIDKSLNDNQEFYINLHPFLKGKLNISKYDNIKLFPKEYETYDFLNKCDVLVTDYSSIFFDFVNTNKKIILFTYDKESYLKDRGMYLDINDFPFSKVSNVSELIEEINDKRIVKYDKFLKEYCSYDSKDVSKKILSLVLENDEKNVKLISNRNTISSVLIESNSFIYHDISKELYDYVINYTENKKLYLGFRNSLIEKNKNILNKFDRGINYFGYYGSFEYTSLFELFLLKLLVKNRKVYSKFKKKYDYIFKNELGRRYDYVSYSDVVLYKEKSVLNIYLYSYMDSNKVIVLEKVPNIDFEVLNRYEKIVVLKEKDKDYLSKFIDIDKIIMIDKFSFNKFL